MKIERLNPKTMYSNPAFTQVATITPPAKLIFVGGQNGIDKQGKVVGSDIQSQSAQSLKNVITALEAAGATLDDVVKLSIYIVQGNSLNDAFAAVQPLLKDVPPATVSGMFVVGLANPEYLIEIDAIAAVAVEADE